MAIIDLQQRSRELGRIRMGQYVPPTDDAKGRPAKLDRFRLTSPSRPLLEQVAHLYGGDVTEWTPQGGGPGQFEVLTEATRLPVLVPPQPVTQFYEHWTAGGCARRCDGVTELLSDRPCLCGPDPTDRLCKPTTRLSVVLRDVPGLGVWRLETHGYYAAVELPQVAGFLAQAGGYVSAFLALEERVVKRHNGDKIETRRFMVPILEVDITPGQLLAGEGSTKAPELPAAQTPALEAGPGEYLADAAAATTVDEVRAIWIAARDANHLTGQLKATLEGRAAALGSIVDEAPRDPDYEWAQIVAACPIDWTTDQLRTDFAAESGGVMPESATPEQLAHYLQMIQTLSEAPA